MRIIALEEHMATRDVVEAWRRLDPAWQDVGLEHSSQGPVRQGAFALAIAREACFDCAVQGFRVNRFYEEFDSPCLHGANACWDIGITADKREGRG